MAKRKGKWNYLFKTHISRRLIILLSHPKTFERKLKRTKTGHTAFLHTGPHHLEEDGGKTDTQGGVFLKKAVIPVLLFLHSVALSVKKQML